MVLFYDKYDSWMWDSFWLDKVKKGVDGFIVFYSGITFGHNLVYVNGCYIWTDFQRGGTVLPVMALTAMALTAMALTAMALPAMALPAMALRHDSSHPVTTTDRDTTVTDLPTHRATTLAVRSTTHRPEHHPLTGKQTPVTSGSQNVTLPPTGTVEAEVMCRVKMYVEIGADGNYNERNVVVVSFCGRESSEHRAIASMSLNDNHIILPFSNDA